MMLVLGTITIITAYPIRYKLLGSWVLENHPRYGTMHVNVHHSQIHVVRKTEVVRDMISLQREYTGVYSLRDNHEMTVRFYKRRDRFQNLMGLRVGTLREDRMRASVRMDIDWIDDMIVMTRVVKQTGVTCYELQDECLLVRGQDRHTDSVPPLTIFIMGQFWGFLFSHCLDFLFHRIMN